MMKCQPEVITKASTSEVRMISSGKKEEILYFQCRFNKTCWSNYANFITEDTIKTASHFTCKDCLPT